MRMRPAFTNNECQVLVRLIQLFTLSCISHLTRRRYVYRYSTNSKNTSVTLSERFELSGSVDRETPFQLDQVMEEQCIVQFHVHVT